ncbi:MAG: DnaD domain protein [Clostridioides sp.]|jgi:DnaD/phage-associated family protein|nr:DnaD domain protein [Clostridioides sp.]
MFFKEINENDLGETSIPNIFLDIFMPKASSLELKVYLMGYRQACDKSASSNFNNYSIANILGEDYRDVIAAWMHWQERGIVKVHVKARKKTHSPQNTTSNKFDEYSAITIDDSQKIDTQDNKNITMNDNNVQNNFTSNIISDNNFVHNNSENNFIHNNDNHNIHFVNKVKEDIYTIEFMDLKKYYEENILCTKSKHTEPEKSDTDILIETIRNPIISQMFNTINKMIGRPLAITEKTIVIKAMNKFNSSPDMVVYAYEKSLEKDGYTKPPRYIETILRDWFDKNYTMIEHIKAHESNFSKMYSTYKEVYKNLGIRKEPTDFDKQIINSWIDRYNMSNNLIVKACEKANHSASAPTVNYVNKIIERWHEKGINTLEDVARDDEEFKNSKEKQKETTGTNSTKNNMYKNNLASNNTTRNVKKTSFDNFTETYTIEELNEIVRKKQSSNL